MPPPDSPSGASPDLAVQAAARLLAEGEAGEAVVRLERLVAAAPAYPAVHVLLARALEASGRPGEALASWHRAHFLVPNSPLVHRERQRLLEALSAPPAPAGDEAEPPADRGPAETSEALAAAPAGDLPDAHLALTEEDAAGATPVEGQGGEEQEANEEPVAEEPLPPEDPYDEAPVVEWYEEPIVGAAEDEVVEPIVAPPDLGGTRTGPAAAAPEPGLDEPEEEEGWTMLEETEEVPPVSEVAEPLVAPPDGPAASPSPEEDAPGEEDAPLADTLEALIHQLEDAPRIRPDPTFSGPEITFDEEIADDMVSETLARIYAAQRQYAQAAIVYEKLAQQRPEQADEMLRRAAEMRAQGEA